jgi:hypothetical protein
VDERDPTYVVIQRGEVISEERYLDAAVDLAWLRCPPGFTRFSPAWTACFPLPVCFGAGRLLAPYDNGERVHTELQDSPVGRPVEPRPSHSAKVIGLPRVGGLHHRCAWRDVA